MIDTKIKQQLNGKKVFVTGSDGFIGSHLVELLVEAGAQVRALVYYNSWNQIGWLKDIPSSVLNQVEIVRGDIRDAEFVRSSLRGQEYIFHLSSLIAIPYSYEAPGSYVETNVTGALNVLQGCRASDSIERIIHVSTSEVYGSAQYVPIDEKHPIIGQSPYSASKIAADKMAESFYLSFGLPVVTARPFNTYGPRQTARAIIPTVASQLIGGSKTLKVGSVTPTRDFNYVRDTANGMLHLAICREAEGRVINIGSGVEWSIQQTIDYLVEITGKCIEVEVDEQRIRPEKSEVNRLLADNTEMKKITSWVPKTEFREGLLKTTEWIEKNLQYFNPEDYSR